MRYVRLKRPAPAEQPAAVAERQTRRQLAWAAGAEAFRNRDPLYHITEAFQMNFDAVGRRHARDLTGEKIEPAPTGAALRPSAQEAQGPTGSRSFYERGREEEQDLLRKFSETAFQRGTLFGAVLQGSGRMMLFSCLKKTVGQSQPVRWQQRKLFEKASPHRNVPGHNPDQVVFNRSFTDSAVGLVVDTLRDARRTLEDLEDLARGKSEMGRNGGARTLQILYPFLDDGRERALQAQYRGQMQALPEGDPARPVLLKAAGRAGALIAKKAQMRVEFINKLRFLSDRAVEALADLEQPGFADALDTALRQTLDAGAGQPPEKGGEDHGATAGENPPGGGTPPGTGGEEPTVP